MSRVNFAVTLMDRLKGCAGQMTGKHFPEAVRDAAGDVLLEGDHLTAAQAMVGLITALEDAENTTKKALMQAKAALLDYIEESGAPAVSNGLHVAGSTRGKASVLINDIAALPDAYLTTPAPQPDKDAIRAALLAGKAIPGAVLHNGAPHLTIRVAKKERAA